MLKQNLNAYSVVSCGESSALPVSHSNQAVWPVRESVFGPLKVLLGSFLTLPQSKEREPLVFCWI